MKQRNADLFNTILDMMMILQKLSPKVIRDQPFSFDHIEELESLLAKLKALVKEAPPQDK